MPVKKNLFFERSDLKFRAGNEREQATVNCFERGKNLFLANAIYGCPNLEARVARKFNVQRRSSCLRSALKREAIGRKRIPKLRRRKCEANELVSELCRRS